LDDETGLELKGAVVAGVLAVALGPGCRARESPEAVMARVTAESRRTQIANLETLIAQAEKGEIVTTDQIVIGVSEELLGSLLRASLPPEIVVANRLRLRIESTEPLFRGGQAGILFKVRVTSTDAPDANATISMGGSLDEFKFEGGKLSARVKVKHFNVLESSIGDLGANVLDGLVRGNLEAIEKAIPEIEVPVQLEQQIRIAGLTEGAVVAKPGVLPLAISVSRVIPANKRLWVLLDAKAGPWKAAEAEKAPATDPPTAKSPVTAKSPAEAAR
jgi:hypothetical protein